MSALPPENFNRTRVERDRNEDSRTLHVLDEVLCYSSGEFKFMLGTYTFLSLS